LRAFFLIDYLTLSLYGNPAPELALGLMVDHLLRLFLIESKIQRVIRSDEFLSITLSMKSLLLLNRWYPSKYQTPLYGTD